MTALREIAKGVDGKLHFAYLEGVDGDVLDSPSPSASSSLPNKSIASAIQSDLGFCL